MKKAILTALLSGFIYSFGICQGPVLYNFNYVPKINETQVFIRTDTTGITFDLTGINYLWDYTNLKTTDTKVYTIYMDPESTTFISYFNNATLASGVSGYYNYYYSDTNEYSWLGSGSSSYVMVNSDPLKYCVFPFKYGDNMNDTMHASYTISSMSHQYFGYTSLYADGWGTLKLPKNTYTNVIRTRSQQYNRDTSVGMKTETYYSVISWYDGIHNIPLLRSIDYKRYETGNPSPTVFKSINIAEFTETVSIPSLNNIKSVTIYPNPANNELNIELDIIQRTNVDISLIDLLGNMLRSIDTKELGLGKYQSKIDLSELPKGIYAVKIIAGNDIQLKKIIIQ